MFVAHFPCRRTSGYERFGTAQPVQQRVVLQKEQD